MKRKSAIWLLLSLVIAAVIFLLLSSWGLRIVRNISYVQGDMNPSRQLDLYMPQYRSIFEKPRPLIIWIHGGAWRAGSKDNSPGTLLPQFGYVAASINYRLANEATFPAQLDDCLEALRFLRKHSSEYGIDKDKIGIWGLSSGGQLAALVGLKGGAPDKNGIDASDLAAVKAVCDWCGPTDFMDITKQAGPGNKFELSSPNGPVAKFLGGLPANVPERAKQASPVSFIHAGAPPFLILHGSSDEVVPLQQSIELSKLLQKCGDQCTFKIIPGGKHEFYSVTEIMESIDFFNQYLKQ